MNSIASQRGYKNRDEIVVSPEKMGDAYEDKVKMFFAEHLHEDEEIRYVREGQGYFDVRSVGDDWVRVKVEKDDLLILPAGIYHRFTTAEGNVSDDPLCPGLERSAFTDWPGWQYIKAMRLFQEEPKWTPLNRGPDIDENKYRKAYLEERSSKAVPTA